MCACVCVFVSVCEWVSSGGAFGEILKKVGGGRQYRGGLHKIGGGGGVRNPLLTIVCIIVGI